jgi:deoxyribodipyrimidine photo-lyase
MMRRDFADREELITYLKEQFPQVPDTHVSKTKGGRKAAEIALKKIDPMRYAQSRNFLTGAVTHLSPYLRHGVLSLAEVRDYVFQQVADPTEGEKLITELAWRDYWQRLYAKLGEGIWQDQEDYKTGYISKDYNALLPQEIQQGTTGMVCMDSFSQELRDTGYLHNHSRMWLAAYIVHWRRIKWQAGAKWFLEHLLDGDPASNNLSWQWVASTLSHKPYFFNRENLDRYTKGVYCRRCPLVGRCDLEGSYAEIEGKLFPRVEGTRKEGNSQSWQKGKPPKK